MARVKITGGKVKTLKAYVADVDYITMAAKTLEITQPDVVSLLIASMKETEVNERTNFKSIREIREIINKD